MVRGRGERHLVIAFFDNAAAGAIAVRVLGKDPCCTGDTGTVGMLLIGSDGSIDLGKLGVRTTGGSAGIGAVLGVIASAISGEVVPERGGLLDADSDLSTDDVARFAADLESGEAGVAVLTRPSGSEEAIVRLTELGGKTEIHHLTRGALRRAAAMAPAVSS